MNTESIQPMNNAGNELPIQAKRNYKDTLFRMIFQEPEELLQLYNAINGTDYTNPADLEIVTLENAIYLNMKNDVAFIVGCYLNLYEQQSSVNPNMPLRCLQYVTKEYEKFITDQTIYSSKLLKIPTPNFIVFYNGTAKLPERLELKLSDAFETPTENPALELRVIQLNINVGHNEKLMERCQTLKEYTLYVERVRKYAREMPLNEAVTRAVQECIKENILADFLTKYKAEAISMSIFEYDEERELALIRRDERELGVQEGIHYGIQQGIQQGIEAFILDYLEEGIPQERIIEKLIRRFHLSHEQAQEYFSTYAPKN